MSKRTDVEVACDLAVVGMSIFLAVVAASVTGSLTIAALAAVTTVVVGFAILHLETAKYLVDKTASKADENK